MKYLFVIVFLSVISFACSSTKHGTAVNPEKTSAQTNSVNTLPGVKGGSSYQNAIFIDAKSEGPGVDKEYAWLKKNYPGYSLTSQSLNKFQGKSYDIIKIKTVGGVEKPVYFDISKFFGKF